MCLRTLMDLMVISGNSLITNFIRRGRAAEKRARIIEQNAGGIICGRHPATLPAALQGITGQHRCALLAAGAAVIMVSQTASSLEQRP